ncbi:MAG: signal peptidase I [Nocardioidaceae bacterium]
MITEAPEKSAVATKRRGLPLWMETVVLLVVAVLISALIKTFLVQMFWVPSVSMEPLFIKNDRILVEKWSYWNSPIQRGDVIVFRDPGGKWLEGQDSAKLNPLQTLMSKVGLYPTGGHLVKRVIGVAGDHVACCDVRGRVTVNGVPLIEGDYIKKGSDPSSMPFHITVPAGHVWVMGDYRDDSEDSRFHTNLPGHGSVPDSDVVGKVWALVWPFGRATFLHTPSTFDNPKLG